MPTPAAAGRAPQRAEAWFAGVHASDAVECVDVLVEPERLAAGGWWAVVGDFDGPVRAWRFRDVRRVGRDDPAADDDGDADPSPWTGPPPATWRSSLDEDAYRAAVERTRGHIRDGWVYQANICRVLSAPLPRDAGGAEPDARALGRVLAVGNPAPFAGGVHVPAGGAVPGVWVVTASPELYLRVDGDTVTSSPIKGTATTAALLTDKDRAENVMITDLVRNDLQRVCEPGTVDVTHLLAVEHHPGLVHLVSTVTGTVRPDVLGAPDRWGSLVGETYPPGSVSGAPKSAALRVIAELETRARGPYCGVVGWIDADAGRAELAVGIRTFWWTDDDAPRDPGAPDGDDAPAGTLRFGTGAGITWESDAGQEWAETQLKAARLVGLASHPSGPAAD